MSKKTTAARFAQGCMHLIGVALLLSGCSTPIGVVRGTTQEIHHALTANVLSSGEPSSWSNQVLQRANLYDRFHEDQEAALREMHKNLDANETTDRLFALAALSFTHAEQSGKNEYYRAAAVYAGRSSLSRRRHDATRSSGSPPQTCRRSLQSRFGARFRIAGP